MEKKNRILYIEDHDDTRTMIVTLLQSAGYEVSDAATIEAGLAIAKFNDHHLFIIDNHYPEGTGVQLCKKLRIINSNTPIIVYTGSNLEREKKAILDAGANICLIKPTGL